MGIPKLLKKMTFAIEHPYITETLFLWCHLLDCLLALMTLGFTLKDGGVMMLSSLDIAKEKVDKYLNDRDFEKFFGIFKICYVAYFSIAVAATFVSVESRYPIAFAWMAVYAYKLYHMLTEKQVRKENDEVKQMKDWSGVMFILCMYMPMMGGYIWLKSF